MNIFKSMTQAQLIVITDHYLDFKDKESIINQCLNFDCKELLQQALNIQCHLENYKEPDKAEKIVFQKIDMDGNIYFSVNQIEIRISKHLIRFRFPFIFRVFVDYEALRQAYFIFLHAFLLPFHTTEIIAFPSFWNYNEYEIKNQWHRKRLCELQYKIVHEAISYKRCKLNLAHCLEMPDSDLITIMAKKYRVWMLFSYNDLCVI